MVKLNDTKNMFETLEVLRKDYEANKTLFEERTAEFERAKKAIERAYDKRIEEAHEIKDLSLKKLKEFDKLISEYSTFDTKLLCEILKQLVSTVECEEYSYQEAIHDTKRRAYGPIDSWDVDVHKQVKLIIRRNEKREQYRSSNEYSTEITQLVEKGKAILLEEKDYCMLDKNEYITFYSANNGEVKCLVDFGRFDYVKEFIDIIIQDRFQNNKKTITEKYLLTFMSEFVSSHKDLIASNYQLRITEQQEALQREIDDVQRELDEYNKKMNYQKN